jgi:hypothetical protein
MKKIAITIMFVFGAKMCAKAQTKLVMLDSYFNDEHLKNVAGEMESYHYKWEENDNNGFSIFGNIFKKNNAILSTLYQEPTAENLKKAAIYIIVDPDTKKESPNPKYIFPADVNVISEWVAAGGILIMMANDSANVELPHFNTLAAKFGMHFTDSTISRVINDQHFDDGAIKPINSPIFKTATKLFMKDACSITLSGTARPVLWSGKSIIMAQATYGKGIVLAVGDPWLYNEYVNGRLPASFDNDKGANDIVAWLLQQAAVTVK